MMPRLLLLFLLLYTTPITADLAAVESWLTDNANATLSRLINFVSIPSVSADPTRKTFVRRAATWLHSDLRSTGLENVRLLENPGHPSVYADWLHAPNAPTILIYGHYDVQPEDPLELWESPPFEPTVRDGKLYARGASDDKGHMYAPVTAIRAMLAVEGKLPVNVKLFFEGEEEVGSPNLKKLFKEHAELLQADFAFSADGGQPDDEVPGLCLGLRGSMSMQVSLKVADSDMHSGRFGGGVQNPLHVLAGLLASLRDLESGRVLVDGFYDDVDEIEVEERKDVERFMEFVGDKLDTVGVNESTGEVGFSFYERTWFRPTVEVVGMWGGFTGEGIKTVLPREAHAKMACRLVSSQDVEKTQRQLREHLEREGAKIAGVEVVVEEFAFESAAFKMRRDAGGNAAAARVLRGLYGKEPIYFSMGGSIPALSYIRDELGLETTMFAFGGSGENVHAPNEFASIASLRRGEKAYVRLFEELSKVREGKEEL